MGMRFRKSFKLLPGVKVNVGKKSIGVSAGNKYGGVSVNSKTGVRGRASVPGTGISYSATASGKGRRAQTAKEIAEIEPCTIAFDEKTLQSLNDAAFNDYMLSYLEYAKTVAADNPELGEVEKQVNMLKDEQIRRFKEEEEKTKAKNEPSLMLLICGIICGICGLFIMFFTIWGLAFLVAGLLMLLAEYNKKG